MFTPCALRRRRPALTDPSGNPLRARRLWRSALLVLSLPTLLVVTVPSQAQPAAQAGLAVSAADKSVERSLERLLLARPELVRDALKELERRETAAKAQQEKQVLASSSREIYSQTGATVLGNPKGDFTLVEFTDYHCGYCKRLSTQIDELVQRDGQLRVLVKHMPILGAESIQAAQMVLSLPQGARAQQMHRALMASNSLDANALQAIGKQFQFTPGATAEANRGLGEVRLLSEKLHIEGTPALVIGDTLVRGALDRAQLESLIRAARQTRAAAGRLPSLKLAALAPDAAR